MVLNFRKLRVFLLTIILMPMTYAVQVIQETTQPVAQEGASGLAVFILTIFFTGLIILGFLAGFLLVLLKIYKKISEYHRKKKDFIYSLYSADYGQCILNANPNMKKRNWKRLWLFYKRKPVYMRNKEGFEVLGYYDGECYKKEGYYCICLFHKLGMFKTYDNIILIPIKLKDSIVSKINVEGSEVYVLDCEGIDQIGNTDYYYQPLIWDKLRKEFIDYNDVVHKEYFEKATYRDIIKENLQLHRENIIKSLEANPIVQHNRRK